MKLKLTHSQFQALLGLLQTVSIGIRPNSIEANVLLGVLFRLYKKFYVKAVITRKKYNISIEADEACAFYMFFSKFDMWQQDEFTRNLVRMINDSVHQKYSA